MMEHVVYETHGPAAWITLDRPDKRNALTPAMVAGLGTALDRALGDPSIRAVVLTGNGSAFCAGADLGGTEMADAALGADGTPVRNPFAHLLQRLQHSPKPMIAAINGPAFGGGLGLVAAADIAIASSGAAFAFSEVRLGLVPAMISVVVLPKLGSHHARRLFVTGRRFTADEALDYGFVHRVISPMTLVEEVAEEVSEIAKSAPEAVAMAKRLVFEIPQLSEDAAFDRASALYEARIRSAEAQEGMAAFREKRPASWRHQ